jgi:hypothetical protein
LFFQLLHHSYILLKFQIRHRLAAARTWGSHYAGPGHHGRTRKGIGLQTRGVHPVLRQYVWVIDSPGSIHRQLFKSRRRRRCAAGVVFKISSMAPFFSAVPNTLHDVHVPAWTFPLVSGSSWCFCRVATAVPRIPSVSIGRCSLSLWKPTRTYLRCSSHARLASAVRFSQSAVSTSLLSAFFKTSPKSFRDFSRSSSSFSSLLIIVGWTLDL